MFYIYKTALLINDQMGEFILSVKLTYADEMMTLVVSFQPGGAPGQIINDLYDALAKISGSLDDESLYFRTIDISGKWRPGDGEFDPWDSSSLDGWIELAMHPEVLDDLRTWLEDVEKLQAGHVKEKYSSIMETDEVLLGEVPMSILAVISLDFVPIYMRFLDVWPELNTIQRDSIVEEIVTAHGRCCEVEELLIKLVDTHGGSGDLVQHVLRTELEKLYGDFPKSDLFRRMVKSMHAKGPEFQDNTGQWLIFNYTTSWPEMGDSARAIVAELDAALQEPQ